MKSLVAVCFNYFLSITIFLNIDISQGSVAKRLRCGGIFRYDLVENLPVSLPVKEFWKSVNISGSYGQEFGVLFFLRHSVEAISDVMAIAEVSFAIRMKELSASLRILRAVKEKQHYALVARPLFW